MPVYLDGLGNVVAYYTVTVHTRVDGQLMSVNYREGEYVKEGDLLALVDPRPYQVQLEQAQGTLARDQATLANARVDLARYENLIKQSAIPEQQLATQQATVRQDEGNIKADQGAVDAAKLQLTYCRITAPISGRIGLRLVDPGNIVHASDTNGLLVITQMQPITAIFTLPEDQILSVEQRLRHGATLPVEAYNRDKSQKLATGRLLTIDNQIDQTTGTGRLKAVFENRNSTLFPNLFVNVRLLLQTLHNQVILPTVGVQRGANGTFAWVILPNNTVQVRTIVTGIDDHGKTSIVKGLNAGDRVVTDGADKLQNGSKVVVRPEPSAAQKSPTAGTEPGETGGPVE
jgi:membrane fusion protein, multidrug efflux system